MKKHFIPANVLLPKENFEKWSVVACDQYTSEPDYWNEVSKLTEGAYSTLFVTVPEIYLNDSDIDERIKNTNATIPTTAERLIPFSFFALISTIPKLKHHKIQNHSLQQQKNPPLTKQIFLFFIKI